MSIHTCIPVGCVGCFDEAEALRAERDALAEHNRAHLKNLATLEESERELTAERDALKARVAELDADLARAEASQSPEQHRISLVLRSAHDGRNAAEASLKVEREAHAATKARYDDALLQARLFVEQATERDARERGLRAALVELVQYERKRHPPKMGGDELPPSLRKLVEAADAALAAPAGEGHVCSMLTPKRDCPACGCGR